ncbi:SDR family oxidoreductase [Paracoccus sp. PS-1]|uniref:SDR family oxidoreductase n=1 Tax=unclassified Paracoccus (in: a-proteobacteria) TaxID=2688777 RepID=UPI00048C9A1F|nr:MULTISPECIES: SDR family oxidoreductase [unclassified Paracoccus (in: a-proteobacteria)]MDQ7262112.1 SDR family oxidoreductase [Paracoccus sp. PS1]RQP05954.1 MAG: SDR family oxidoreductase [Paracoccus sp. BP8]UFM67125.1 SDR family oxidoreductase [Paracoccus sp. MA]
MTRALVTGATSGIGRAIALSLRDAGHEVIAVGRQPDALADLEAQGVRGLGLDLAEPAALRSLAELAPDILVNNAGMMPAMVNFCDLPEDEMQRAIAVNLTAVLQLTRMIAPGMRQRGRGHIFFTGSTAGHAPFPNLAVYCATKAAIGGFAQALRLDMAPHGVRVTEIVAGRVESGLYKDLLSEEARAAMYAGNSAVQPQDVAAMVLSIWKLPQAVDVARFDILPTHQATATGGQNRKQG